MNKMISLNKLYKKSGAKAPFKNWIEKGKALFEHQKDSNLIPKELSFEGWANVVSDSTIQNADGKKGIDWNKVGDLAKKAVTLGAGIIEAAKKPEESKPETPVAAPATYTPEPKKKTILGLKPVAFYAVASVAVLGIGFAIFKIATRKKS
jgi:hypothetical protein